MNQRHPFALPGIDVFEDEHDAIQHFLHHFPPDEAAQMVYELFSQYLLTDTFAGLDTHARAHLLLFCEQLPVLVQASLQLQEARIRQGAREHYFITPSPPLNNATTTPSPKRKRAGKRSAKKSRA